MMYCIRGYCHLPTHLRVGAHGFAVDLSAEWPDLVRRAGITDEQIQHMLKEKAEHWLDAAGYGGHFTEESGLGSGRKYPARCVRVTWGEWGPEHITVPGNACGLDIEKRGFGSVYVGDCATLQPHNVDSLSQKYLLTIVFTEIAYLLMLFARCNQDDADREAARMAQKG